MDRVKVFFCEPSGNVAFWLRRYRSSAEHKCSATGSYCNGMVPFGRAAARLDDKGYLLCPDSAPSHEDPRWPSKCDACGGEFDASDHYQFFQDRIYRDAAGREWPLRELPAGSCYDARWYGKDMRGPDGRSLIVILPDGHSWCIDGRASNCTLPNDTEHRCWVRHGRPEDGTLHVDKDGKTCSAGAGSIGTPKYHGFLHHGHLLKC